MTRRVTRLLERDLKQLHTAFVEVIYASHDAAKIDDEQLEQLLVVLSEIDNVSEGEIEALVEGMKQPVVPEEAAHEQEPEGEPFMEDDDPRRVWG